MRYIDTNKKYVKDKKKQSKRKHGHHIATAYADGRS